MSNNVICEDDQNIDDDLLAISPVLIFLLIICFFIFCLAALLIAFTRIKIILIFLTGGIWLLSMYYGFETMAWLKWIIFYCTISLIIRFIYLREFNLGNNWIN
ncbi:MAG: hypothetical protein U5L76_03900 [Patescibacteria group bacterium]|nr:hypothetical protein [Patescibacteria group bacterium]